MQAGRIAAIALRHAYVIRRHPIRIAELVYWPLLDLLVWGFLGAYLESSSVGRTPAGTVLGTLVGGLILWDLLFRAQQGVSLAYLEEVWSRNLLNLFVSPLTLGEYLVGSLVVSCAKVAFSTVLMIGVAALAYHFQLFSLGFALVPFVVCLLAMGWSIGIATTAAILRHGQGAENLAWAIAFLFQPFSAVFYPVTALPGWMQPIALALPSTHVFEGMRAVLAGQPLPWKHVVTAAGLDVVMGLLAVGYFHVSFRQVRELGLLAKSGE
ncbi:MAG: ABC transporter permease [bacterium]|jgi:ABC-2 type transport system permease protein|nr:ABC transporter permease [bacterium]